jgi:ubiquitin carboxyl-terminal hydrolase 7
VLLQDEIMKGTPMAGTISRLFEGKSQMVIRCKNVDFKSERTEVFHDLSLNVKGLGNLRAAFDQYVAEEELTGDNKYRAEGHGLQDATKGLRFIRFPPVLQLQLKVCPVPPVCGRRCSAISPERPVLGH